MDANFIDRIYRNYSKNGLFIRMPQNIKMFFEEVMKYEGQNTLAISTLFLSMNLQAWSFKTFASVKGIKVK